MEKPDYHLRAEKESEELDKRLTSLENFIDNNVEFSKLDVVDQRMLRDQRHYMSNYLAALDTRIAKMDTLFENSQE